MTRPVSGASAAVFRIGFGLVGFILIVRFFVHGWIDTLLLEPAFHFKYPGFGWVEPLPGPAMYGVFGLIGLAAVAVGLGYRHRLAATVFALGIAYVELIDRTNYLNHYYWLIITGLLLAFLPVSQVWSVDAKLGRVENRGFVPTWVVWLLRFQVGMVYFFAGLAKLNADWLFRAEPLATWLPARSEMWLIGPVVALPIVAFALSWLAAFFDLTVGAWLLNRRTRVAAFATLVAFHFSTWVLFPSIGVFPLVMSLGALVFFDPDWPERMGSRRRVADFVFPSAGRVLKTAVAAYVLVMLLIPLRHYAIPGDVRWTAEGYHGSWHVMLTEKTGRVEFLVTDASGRSWRVPPPEYLTDHQVAVMSTDPSLIQQTARLISDELDVVVTADSRVSFNGRPSVPFTDPSVVIGESDLAAHEMVTAAP